MNERELIALIYLMLIHRNAMTYTNLKRERERERDYLQLDLFRTGEQRVKDREIKRGGNE